MKEIKADIPIKNHKIIKQFLSKACIWKGRLETKQ